MITYKKAAITDLERISYLMTKLHTDADYEELLEENKHFIDKGAFFVAVDGEKIIAYVFGLIRRDYVEGSLQYKDPIVGYIESLYVLPKYRKQGIARELCGRLEEWARDMGAAEFASDAYASNKRSINFHKAIGFEATKPVVHFIKPLTKK